MYRYSQPMVTVPGIVFTQLFREFTTRTRIWLAPRHGLELHRVSLERAGGGECHVTCCRWCSSLPQSRTALFRCIPPSVLQVHILGQAASSCVVLVHQRSGRWNRDPRG